MMSAAQQKQMHSKLVRITCSVERLKRMIVKSRGLDPDSVVEGLDGPIAKLWEGVADADVARYVNFANMFLFTGNATIKVVDKEPDPERDRKVQLVLPEGV